MLLAVENLSHHYGDRKALNDFTLHLNRREILGLLGPNGSGKSTLLRILSTLTPPQNGRVEICGFDAARHPNAVRSRIGVVFQSPTLDKLLTVEENLLACGCFYGLQGRTLYERVRIVQDQLRISDRRNDLAGTLSGGLQRRAEIARALLHEPQLLILDEPSTGLDPAAREDFWQALEQLRSANNTAVLLSTHLFDEAERCDSLILLDEGNRVAEGSPADLKATIGGEVIEIVAKDPLDALARLQEQGYSDVRLLHGTLLLEAVGAHQLIPRLVEALPGQILSVGLHQPTLKDVFLKVTTRTPMAVTA